MKPAKDTSLSAPLREELKNLETEAAEKFAAFKKVKEEYEAKGLKGQALIDDSDAFETVHEAHKSYGEVAENVTRVRDRLMTALDMEGESGPRHEGEPEGKGSGKSTMESIEALQRMLSSTMGEKMADAFIESEEYKAIQAKAENAPDSYKVGNIDLVEGLKRPELQAMLRGQKALVSGGGATTGDVVIINDRQSGIVDVVPRNVRAVLPLVTVGTTDSDTVEWVELTTRTNNAAERAEATTVSDSAADAPESGFTLTLRSQVVREIKHFIPATRIGLADAGQLRTLIDSELLEGLQDRLELQILAGNGTAPNLRGILNTSGIQTQTLGTDSKLDATYKALTKVLIQNFNPDAIVMNPLDWQDVRLAKDLNENYLMGSPNAGDIFTAWGYPVRLSANLTAGTILVGAFARGATLWLRQGAGISATDSHSDWFIRGVIAILASMRAAFGVTRPKAFCTVA